MKARVSASLMALALLASGCTSDAKKICDKATALGAPIAGPGCEAAVTAMKECTGWDDGIVTCVEGASLPETVTSCLAQSGCAPAAGTTP